MPRSEKSTEIREQMKTCQGALVELETRAGIGKAAEKLRNAVPAYWTVYDEAEPYSDKKRELENSLERSHQEETDRRIRNLYFSVRDLELRKALIAKDREIGDLALHYWQQDLSDVARACEAAQKAHYWWLWASMWGIAFIAVGFRFFGLIGALGGALVGFFNGWRIQQEAVRDRAAKIAEAEQDLKEADQLWNKVRNQPQMFSQQEAKTGAPDRERT
jgi:hypothetical protein